MAARTDSNEQVTALAGSAARAALNAIDAEAARDFASGADITTLLACRTGAIDDLVIECWREHMGKCPFALFATGGYGRREMFPQSDIDLLILVDGGLVADDLQDASAPIGAFIAALWDAGLKPGHAVRNLAGCREAASDLTVVTSLMDARLLSGDPPKAELLANAIAPPLWPAAAYLSARQHSQEIRHARFNDTAWNLEPNIKDGPGGLRDLHTLIWVAQRTSSARSLVAARDEGLIEKLINPAEFEALRAARDHVARVRFALHRAAGRAEERLLFDYQRELARGFGFDDEHAGNLAVEQFMQAWFRAAQTIDRLNERVITRCAERLAAGEGCPRTERLDEHWQLLDGALAAIDGSAIAAEPARLIEPFAWLARRADITGFHSSLIELLDEALTCVGTRLR
ncbi:MAG: DUF294 nucleotidyltransferase-like domain-containing protein, partial [Lysobacterales bacterium]